MASKFDIASTSPDREYLHGQTVLGDLLERSENAS